MNLAKQSNYVYEINVYYWKLTKGTNSIRKQNVDWSGFDSDDTAPKQLLLPHVISLRVPHQLYFKACCWKALHSTARQTAQHQTLYCNGFVKITRVSDTHNIRLISIHYAMLTNQMHFLNSCFNSVLLVFNVFRTYYVHRKKDYEVVSKIFQTGAAIYTAVVVARSTGW
jgi:hypothetical protein